MATEYLKLSFKMDDVGVLAVVQWDRQLLCSTKDAGSVPGASSVCSRIQHYHSCSVGCNCNLDLLPGPEIPQAAGRPKKRWMISLGDVVSLFCILRARLGF